MPQSVIGASVARDVLDALSCEGFANTTVAGITVHAHRTPVGTLCLKLDGTTSVRYQHAMFRREQRVHYIRCVKPGGEAASINRAFETMRQSLIAETPLLDARERLYLMVEAREVPDAWIDNPPLPNPMDYDAMSLEDVAAWTPLIEALPLKAAATTTTDRDA